MIRRRHVFLAAASSMCALLGYRTTAGDVLLPVGYESTAPIPVDYYLADHPK